MVTAQYRNLSLKTRPVYVLNAQCRTFKLGKRPAYVVTAHFTLHPKGGPAQVCSSIGMLAPVYSQATASVADLASSKSRGSDDFFDFLGFR